MHAAWFRQLDLPGLCNDEINFDSRKPAAVDGGKELMVKGLTEFDEKT